VAPELDRADPRSSMPAAMVRRVTLPALVLALTAALAASALAATRTIQGVAADGLQAAFSFTGTSPTVHDARLTIIKGTRTVYDRRVTSKACGRLCGPAEVGRNAHSVGIAALQAHAPAEVILELFSGGANCCFIDQVFSYDRAHNTFVKTEHDFGDAGALIKPIGPHRRLQFRSADPAFKYAFTDGADSGEPVQVWQFADRAFADVTRSHPGLIRKDAARWFGLFKAHIANGVGLIAAWAADEELLGNDALVQSMLSSEAGRGDLRSGQSGEPTGQAFITNLNHLLVQYGYKP
jgi:hypothetical protein